MTPSPIPDAVDMPSAARYDEEAVRSFWQALGLPGLIDVHTHFMPHNVLRKVWRYFDHAPERFGRQWPIVYRDTEDERVRRLRAFGVRRFSALLYPHKPGMARWLNDWAAAFAARTPDCIHTATFHPEPEAADYVRIALERGARLFKAHLQVGAYDPRHELLDPVWGMLAEARVPVVVHCSSGLEAGPHTGPLPISEVLRRHPRLHVIIAHLGSPEYSAFLDLAEQFRHVHLDTTMTFTDFIELDAPFPASELTRLADLGDRILLGSDFPVIPHRYTDQLTGLARLGLGDRWLRAVCHDNAARLFGIHDGSRPVAV